MRKPRQNTKPPGGPSPPSRSAVTPDDTRNNPHPPKPFQIPVAQETQNPAAEDPSSPWLATITLDNAREGIYSPKTRLATVSQVIRGLATEGYPSSGVILFPGGWLDAGDGIPDTAYCKWAADSLMPALRGTGHTICFGIDGGADADGFARDQLALAVRDGDGLCAVARKFAPSPQEEGHVTLCEDFRNGEAGYPRTFTHRGKTYFPAVCYDSYGISHGAGPNPGVDAVLNCVHCFYPKGQGPSGETYFAKHGFAGAAKRWGCPVFGTAIFYGRRMPPRWPTGVAWTCGEKSTARWRYDENPIAPADSFGMMTDEGLITVRVFDGE